MSSINVPDGAITECRSEFELEFLDRNFGRTGDGRYEDQTTRAMWHAWQVAWCKPRAQSGVPNVEPVAWREWQDKFNDYIYREVREHLPHPDLGEPMFAGPVQASAKDSAHERELLKEIDARDYNAEMADRLAAVIGEITGADVGEHSSDNCPWAAALECAADYLRRRAAR